MDNNLALKVDSLKKEYKLGAIGGGSLQADLQSAWARFRKREDPNLQIGESRKKGQSFLALDGISFEIAKGERVGIIGGNGAGKSTTLKIISHVTAPTSGTVYINGKVSSMLEVGTGFHPELTGRENIYLNGAILGMSRREVKSKIEDIIEFSECRDFIDTPVKRYSSGMYVKLAFSVAAHLDSDIVIMDEVLAVGDMKFQEKCLKKMQDVSERENRTILYVSHNMNTIRKLCDRCIVLNEGKVQYDGDVEEAISLYLGNRISTSLLYKYSYKHRVSNDLPKVRINQIELVDTEENIYPVGSNMTFKVQFYFESKLEKIGFRLEIYNMNNQVVGTVFANESISGTKDQTINNEYRFDFADLSPGKYYAIALTYERDDRGNQLFIDRIEPAFYFELRESDQDNLIWLNQYWGNIHFKNLKRV